MKREMLFAGIGSLTIGIAAVAFAEQSAMRPGMWENTTTYTEVRGNDKGVKPVGSGEAVLVCLPLCN